MSDAFRIEPPETNPKPKRYRTVRPVRVALFSALLLASAAALVLLPERGIVDLDQIKRTITYRNSVPQTVEIGCGKPVFGEDFFAVSDGTQACLRSASGASLCQAEVTAQHPTLLTAADTAILYDIGGNGLYALSTESELAMIRAAGKLLDADLSPQCLAYLQETDSGTELVCSDRSLRVEAHLAQCAVNSDGSVLAAAAYEGKNGEFSSKILIWRDSDVPVTVPLDNQIVRELRFMDDDTLCAIGERCTRLVSADGEILAAYDYGDDTLACFTIWDRGVTLALRSSGGDTMVSLDPKGRLLGTQSTPAVTALHGCGKYLAYATADGLTICYRDLSLYRQNLEIKHISAICCHADGTVLAVHDGTAQLYFYD